MYANEKKSFIDSPSVHHETKLESVMGASVPTLTTPLRSISNPKSLLDWEQETGRAGRDGQAADCYLFFDRIPAVKKPSIKDPGDYSGRAEMIELLQTDQCLRLARRALDNEEMCCVSLNGQYCSNCTRILEEYNEVCFP